MLTGSTGYCPTYQEDGASAIGMTNPKPCQLMQRSRSSMKGRVPPGTVLWAATSAAS